MVATKKSTKPRQTMTGKWYNDTDGKTYSGILHVVYSDLRNEAHIYVGKTRLFQINDITSEKEAKSELQNLIGDVIIRGTPKARK
jgi:hypothetical protein